MLKRICHSGVLLIALATELVCAYAGIHHSSIIPQETSLRLRPSFIGDIVKNDGKLYLVLTNNTDLSIRGIAVIAAGSDTNQKELGQLSFTAPPKEVVSFRLVSANSGGDYYTLTIFNEKGHISYLRTAPFGQSSELGTISDAVLQPTGSNSKLTNSITITDTKNNKASDESGTPEEAGTGNESNEVTVNTQLLAGEAGPDSYILLFELFARRPVYYATLSIKSGKFTDKKPVSLNLNSTVQFRLRNDANSAIPDEKIEYTLTTNDGQVIAKGNIDLDQLKSDDAVTVLDVRTNQPAYNPGETAVLTVLLEGKSPHGFKIEVKAKDDNGKILFSDQRSFSATDAAAQQNFSFTIPFDAARPLVFEYMILDATSGKMFDSGVFEIPLNDQPDRIEFNAENHKFV